jgi:2,3-bisphosphoglycerate-independent phosphoglycerate mutase
MKGILVILDGLGDLPSKQLGDKTPLEAANMPHLDFLATRGELGYMDPVRPGFIPESDEALVSIFGNNLISSARGQLEAMGAGVEISHGDLAYRVNFATIDSLRNGNIIDRRVGRTISGAEAEILSKALNKIELPNPFLFKVTLQHRGILIFKGGFSDNISGNDFTYLYGRNTKNYKTGFCKALDEEEDSVYSSQIVNAFLRRAYDVLENHHVNLERKKKGLLPANYLLIRGPGIEPPKLNQFSKWVSVTYTPLEIGFSKASGMKNFSFEYPKLKDVDSYENLYKGLRKACLYAIKILKKTYKNSDYAYIHFKETDYPGHDNKPLEKKLMLEEIDKIFFKFLRNFVPQNKIKVVVTGDHSTICKLKEHSSDPVPVLFYNDSNLTQRKFSEKEARKGTLGRFSGTELLRVVGFNK